MNWQEYIHSDPEILAGKPIIKGSRMAVDYILNLFAAGWTRDQILENYPSITNEALSAVFAFTAECMRDEAFYTLPSKVA